MRPADHAREPAASPLRRAAAVALVVLLASAAFLGSLAATLPAGVAARYAALPDEINGYSGTLWRGAARLPEGHALDWRLAPRRSLALLAPAFAVRLAGEGSDLEAWVAPRLGGGVRVEALRGRLAWPLVEALAPGLVVACDLAAETDGLSLTLSPGLRSGSGGFAAGPGACLTPQGARVPVPELAGRIETREGALAAVLTLTDAPQEPLAEAALSADDRLALTLHAAGAALVPGLAERAFAIEYALSGLPF